MLSPNRELALEKMHPQRFDCCGALTRRRRRLLGRNLRHSVTSSAILVRRHDASMSSSILVPIFPIPRPQHARPSC